MTFFSDFNTINLTKKTLRKELERDFTKEV